MHELAWPGQQLLFSSSVTGTGTSSAQGFLPHPVHELAWSGQRLRSSSSVAFNSFATPRTAARPAPLCTVPTYKASFQDLNPTPAALGRVLCPEKRPTQGDRVACCAWDSPVPLWSCSGRLMAQPLGESSWRFISLLNKLQDRINRTIKGGGWALPDHTSLIPEVRRPLDHTCTESLPGDQRGGSCQGMFYPDASAVKPPCLRDVGTRGRILRQTKCGL